MATLFKLRKFIKLSDDVLLSTKLYVGKYRGSTYREIMSIQGGKSYLKWLAKLPNPVISLPATKALNYKKKETKCH